MKRRDFLLGASAIVAGAVLPANAVRGPDEGGYLIPPDFREDASRKKGAA